jgi:hypothetical protein
MGNGSEHWAADRREQGNPQLQCHGERRQRDRLDRIGSRTASLPIRRSTTTFLLSSVLRTEPISISVLQQIRSSRFVCRRCTRLRYWTQTVDPMTRLDSAIRKLQRKLANPEEDVNDWDLEHFPKPKWMRWRTHERLVEKGLELVERRDAVWMKGAARVLARLGG